MVTAGRTGDFLVSAFGCRKKLLSLSFQKETAKLGVSDWDRVRDEDREGDRGGNSDKDGDREGDREGQTWTLLLCLDRRIKGSQRV